MWEQNTRSLLDNHRMRLLLHLDELSASYHRVAEAYKTRGDALTLLNNWRVLSDEAIREEELSQLAASGGSVCSNGSNNARQVLWQKHTAQCLQL